MPRATALAEEFGRLVDELRGLGDEPLLWLWRRNIEELDRAGLDLAGLRRRDALRQRHHACRLVTLERFGWAGHLKRRRTGGAGAHG